MKENMTKFISINSLPDHQVGNFQLLYIHLIIIVSYTPNTLSGFNSISSWFCSLIIMTTYTFIMFLWFVSRLFFNLSTVLNALISELDRRWAKQNKGFCFRTKEREKSQQQLQPVPADVPGWAMNSHMLSVHCQCLHHHLKPCPEPQPHKLLPPQPVQPVHNFPLPGAVSRSIV